VHNSRRPLDHLDLWPSIHWIWWAWRTICMPSLAILVSVVLVLSCGQNHRQTHTRGLADDRYTHATTVGASNKRKTLIVVQMIAVWNVRPFQADKQTLVMTVTCQVQKMFDAKFWNGITKFKINYYLVINFKKLTSKNSLIFSSTSSRFGRFIWYSKATFLSIKNQSSV